MNKTITELQTEQLLFENPASYTSWKLIEDKIEEILKLWVKPCVDEGIKIYCDTMFYKKLMHKTPKRMKIRYELSRRGYKPKHLHKIRRNK